MDDIIFIQPTFYSQQSSIGSYCSSLCRSSVDYYAAEEPFRKGNQPASTAGDHLNYGLEL